jgi:hypothetical protein
MAAAGKGRIYKGRAGLSCPELSLQPEFSGWCKVIEMEKIPLAQILLSDDRAR